MTLFPAGQNELEKVQCAEVEQKSNLILIIMFSLISSPETENRFVSVTFTVKPLHTQTVGVLSHRGHGTLAEDRAFLRF